MNYIRAAIMILFVLLGLNNYRLQKKVNELDVSLGNALNNVSQYESILSKSNDENRVLQLTVDQFKQSNDSLVQRIKHQAKELNIKDKQIDQALSVKTVMTDTFIKILPPKEIDFDIEIQPNALTRFHIVRKDSVFRHETEIYNHQDLIIADYKVWRNKRKNFFQRLIHFDFKKDRIQKYQIINSNTAFKTLDTRVIKISK